MQNKLIFIRETTEEEHRQTIESMKNLKHIALLGAICGDIIGSTYEFHPTKSPDFPMLPPGSDFTDDSVMTCAVAEWLMKGGELTNILQSWGQRHGDIGYGPSFLRWLYSDNPKPYNSWGNGAAMRASAVGWSAGMGNPLTRTCS